MSIYSDLLAMSLEDAALGHAGRARSAERRLLDELAEQRRRMQSYLQATRKVRPDAPSRIATEIGYDRALIELCRLHAIPCDPARFTRPSEERRRLEDALEAAGVDVREPRHHAHDPPEGS